MCKALRKYAVLPDSGETPNQAVALLLQQKVQVTDECIAQLQILKRELSDAIMQICPLANPAGRSG